MMKKIILITIVVSLLVLTIVWGAVSYPGTPPIKGVDFSGMSFKCNTDQRAVGVASCPNCGSNAVTNGTDMCSCNTDYYHFSGHYGCYSPMVGDYNKNGCADFGDVTKIKTELSIFQSTYQGIQANSFLWGLYNNYGKCAWS